jgi:hypothetical protein
MGFKTLISVAVLALFIGTSFSVCSSAAAATGKCAPQINSASEIPLPQDVMYSKPANYATLVNWYLWLEQNYSNYLCVFEANDLYGTGQVKGGYDDYYVRLTNESLGFNKPESLFLGGPHGDETAGTVGMYWFCDWLLRHAFNPAHMGAETPYLRWLLDNREIYLEVSHNPYGFDHHQREDIDGNDLNREADMDCAYPAFSSVNGKTLSEFLNHHQIRTGCDFHGGARMLLYPWGSTHTMTQGTSNITGRSFYYAPPDFNYFDSAFLRTGSYMGNAGAYESRLDETNIGTIPVVVGYVPRGSICPWAYGADIGINPAESAFVQYPPYKGAGAMWVTPELSTDKDPPAYQFGGDDTGGFGQDVRRFILHQTDLAQPYLKWFPGTVSNNSQWAPGHVADFKWQVNGSMVVDHTSIIWGDSPDLVNNYNFSTGDRDSCEGKFTGGTGWEGAFDGKLMNPVTYSETITLPSTPGDYYFMARAMVDQAYNTTLAPSEYGANHTYLRLLKERCWGGWSETIANSTDGNETMKGRKWWYSPMLHVKVNSTVVSYLEIFLSAPDGGEKWYTGKSYRINWSISNGTPDYKIDIYLSPDGGFTWNHTIAKGIIRSSQGPGYYQWTVPYTLQNGTKYRVKTQVQDANTDVGVDWSRANFEIVHNAAPPVLPDVHVVSPNGGEKWFRGDGHYVNWTVFNATLPYKVSIYMSDDGGLSYPYIIVTDIPQSAEGNGSYWWLITASYPVSPNCRARIEVKDYNGASGLDMTDSLFEIANRTPPPPPPSKNLSATLVSPNGGEHFLGGSKCDILWNTVNGTPPVSIRLEYSTTGANGTYSLIKDNLPDSGIYNWTLPQVTSSDCYVRVGATDFNSSTCADLCDSPFSVTTSTPPQQKGNITGRVTDSASGRVLDNARVAIYHAGDTSEITSTTTGTDGFYLFIGLDAGSYDLKFTLSGYKEGWLSGVQIYAGETAYKDKLLEKTGGTVTPPPGGNNETSALPLGLSYECLSFLIIGFLVLIFALMIFMQLSKKALQEERRIASSFRPHPKPMDMLQQYLMRTPPSQPPVSPPPLEPPA